MTTRRNFLKISGTGLIVSLAGCSNTPNDPQTTTEDGPDRIDEFLDVVENTEGNVQDGNHPHAHIGDPEAPVELHYFTDFKCPFCTQWDNSTLPDVYRDYIETGDVVMYIHFIAILGEKSGLVGTLAYDYYEQNPTNRDFLTFYTRVSERASTGKTWGTKAVLKDELERVNAENVEDLVETAFDYDSYPSQPVSDNNSLGKELGMTGTPFFAVIENGSEVSNATETIAGAVLPAEMANLFNQFL